MVMNLAAERGDLVNHRGCLFGTGTFFSVTSFAALRMDEINAIIGMLFPPRQLELVKTCTYFEMLENFIRAFIFKSHHLEDPPNAQCRYACYRTEGSG